MIETALAWRAAAELEAAAEELVADGRPDLTTVDQVSAVNAAADVLDRRAAALRGEAGR